jgi:heme-degrading monooxygenase HmoA
LLGEEPGDEPRSYRRLQPDQRDGQGSRGPCAGGDARIFRGQAGFKAYGLAETQEGTVVSVSLWESREQAEQANDLAASWVKENLTDRVQLESAQVGDFLFFENA